MKKPIFGIIIGGGLGALIIFLTFTFLPILPPSEKYDVFVNPTLVKDSMGTETHVDVKNTGLNPLTNVRVDYGGTAKPDIIPILNPGERVTLSPPVGSNLKEVRVTSDEGIDVIKAYNIPTSAPFVGNSGFGG